MAGKKKNEDSLKITIGTLLEDLPLLQQLSQVSLPIKPSYWIGRVLSKVKSELAHYNETRDEFVKKLGEEKEGKFTVKEENLVEFYEEVQKLQDIEVDLDFKAIDLKELGEIHIEPRLLLPWLFKFEE